MFRLRCHASTLSGLCLILVAFGASSLDAGEIYFYEGLTRKVQKSDLNTPSVVDVLDLTPLSPSAPSGIDIDFAASQLYWVESNGGGAINRVNLNGTGNTTLLTYPTTSFPRRVDLDLDAGHLYFSEGGHNSIVRSNLDGTSPTTLVSGVGLSVPTDLEIDTVNSFLYWGDFGTQSVYRSKLDGSDVVTLFSDVGSIRGIAVDLIHDKIYWSGDFSGIKYGNLDGSGVATDLLTSYVAASDDIEIDLVNNKLYWSDRGFHRIGRANLDGTGEEAFIQGTSSFYPDDIILVTGPVVPEPSSLALLLLGVSGCGAYSIRRQRNRNARKM